MCVFGGRWKSFHVSAEQEEGEWLSVNNCFGCMIFMETYIWTIYLGKRNLSVSNFICTISQNSLLFSDILPLKLSQDVLS